MERRLQLILNWPFLAKSSTFNLPLYNTLTLIFQDLFFLWCLLKEILVAPFSHFNTTGDHECHYLLYS